MVHFCESVSIYGADNPLTIHSVTGCYIAWRLRHQSKTDWLSSNKSQKGQETIVRLRCLSAVTLHDCICTFIA